MDFWLTDEQRELQAAVRALVQGRFDLAEVAAAEGTERVVTRWDELADMGIFSMRTDGLGAREAVLAFEELGRGLVPGPVVTTHLAAGLVDGAAEGSTIVGLYEPGAQVTMVEHAAEATSLLWFTADEVRLIDTSSLTLAPVEHPLDPLSPVWTASGDATGEVDRRRPRGDTTPTARRHVDGRPAARRRARGDRARRRIRRGTTPVRSADRELPGGEAHPRRHAHEGRGRPVRRLRRRVRDRRGQPRRTRTSNVRRQGDGRRCGAALRSLRHPGPRRHGVHVGGERPALLEAGDRPRRHVRQQRPPRAAL